MHTQSTHIPHPGKRERDARKHMGMDTALEAGRNTETTCSDTCV